MKLFSFQKYKNKDDIMQLFVGACVNAIDVISHESVMGANQIRSSVINENVKK